MNKTAIFTLILAALTTVWTWVPRSTPEVSPTTVKRAQVLTATGEPVDARAVAKVRVIDIDPTSQAPLPFEVRRDKGQWIIPSHFDYPADGGTMVGETAGAVLNLPMGPLVSADKETHADYGVLDPLSAESGRGAGKRVTLSDAGGAILVDVIIGAPKSGAEVYFVRRANESEVYTASVQPDEIKSSFKDWVETDLLKLTATELREVVVRDYSVDEQSGRLNDRSTTSLSRKADGEAWSLKPERAGQTLKAQTATDLTSEAAQLRLVGVRPYAPEWLQERGFYIGRDATGREQLFGNEGEVQLTAQDGLVYHLFFGEIALGDAVDQAAKQTQSNGAETQRAKQTAHNRYMAVFVQYAKDLDQTIPAPEYAPTEVEPVASPSIPAKQTPTNQSAIDAAIAKGMKRAEEAQARFQRFFYVVDDASFKKLRPAQESFYEEVKAEKNANDEGEAISPVDAVPGLPPGLFGGGAQTP